MSATSIKKDGSKKHLSLPIVKVDKNMKSHADSPYFLKKEAQAKETIKKYGLPKGFSR